MSDAFDFVIVGGGTAASVLAYRLGEKGHSVCVLEAGPPDRHPYLKIPAGFAKTLFHPELTWGFKSDPDPDTGNRAMLFTQGRTLGGSSSLNGMIHIRGQEADYDLWAQAGNRGWSYEDVLPLFKRTEQRIADKVDSSRRGEAGRLTVTTAPWPNALEVAFTEAAVSIGHKRCQDYNAHQDGVGPYQSAIRNGRRVSTATAFLHPARKAYRVEVRTSALVTRIEFDGHRATGVTYTRDRATYRVSARREVIVAAGAFNSPKLLQLSGIGPAQLLKDNGVAPLIDLPGVGENLHEHFGPRIVARAKPGVDSVNLHVSGFPLLKQLAKWLLGQPSVLATSPARVHLFGRSDPALEHPDFTIVFMPASFKAGLVGVLDDFPGLTFGCWPMRPLSRGYVRISGPDPATPPRVNPRYLSEEYDRRVLIEALKTARRIAATEPLASLIEAELFPGPQVATDADLLAFSRQWGATSFHYVGTCKMGPSSDAKAVVGPDLKVHGIAALRVADSSIMPSIPSANTAAASMMIGEKAADLILNETA